MFGFKNSCAQTAIFLGWILHNYTFGSVVLNNILLLSLCVTVILSVLMYDYDYWRNRGVFSPPALPVAGHIWPVVAGKEQGGVCFQRIYNTYKDKRFLGIHQFYRRTLVICDPELVRRVCVNDFVYFTDRGFFFDKNLDPLAESVLYLRGNEWKRLRAKISPIFSPIKLKGMLPLIENTADEFLLRVKKLVKNSVQSNKEDKEAVNNNNEDCYKVVESNKEDKEAVNNNNEECYKVAESNKKDKEAVNNNNEECYKVAESNKEDKEAVNNNNEECYKVAESNKEDKEAVNNNNEECYKVAESNKEDKEAVNNNNEECYKVAESNKEDKEAVNNNNEECYKVAESNKEDKEAVNNNNEECYKVVESNKQDKEAVNNNNEDCYKVVESNKEDKEAVNNNNEECYKVVDSEELMGGYTADAIVPCAFGVKSHVMDNPNDPFAVALKAFYELTFFNIFEKTMRHLWPAFVLFFKVRIIPKKTHDFFFNIVSNVIRERQSGIQEKRGDFIDMMMALQSEDKTNTEENVNDFKITDMIIAANAFIIFLGGYETTSSTLAFLFLELAAHPQVQEKMREEIREVLEKHGGKVSSEALQDLTYMDMVIQETLRLYPPFPTIQRMCTKNYTIPGTDVVVESGTIVVFPTMGLQRDELYFENASRFEPERWRATNALPPPGVYAPFGDGPRYCIGKRFAIIQMKTFLVKLVPHIRISPASKSDVRTEPFAVDLRTPMTLHPADSRVRISLLT